MNTQIIVQARMASTRLPGKVLRKVLNKPLLQYLVERLQCCRRADGFLIATSTNDADLEILDFCTQYQLPVFRGPENDVLSRYYDAAQEIGADVIVRVTADCPLIDPAVIDQAIEIYHSSPDLHYVSNTLDRRYARGMDVEVFSSEALREAYEMATRWEEREHVTPFIHKRIDRYPMAQMTQEEDESDLRWTVDTPEDFALIQAIFEALYPENPQFALADIQALIRQQPALRDINRHIVQKSL